MSKPDNLIGNKYGKLTVVNKAENRGKTVYWSCECECGGIKEISGNNLKIGDTKSCGCLIKEIDNANFIDISGKKYGKLTVLSKAGIHEKRALWNCICECGNKIAVVGKYLRNGSTVSCGCYKKDILGNSRRTHGRSQTRLYKIWKDIKKRCYNPNHESYERYGGSGVKMHDDWIEGYEKFHDCMIDSGYSDCLSIDRIDPYGNYEPGNIRWTTATEQARNTRLSRANKTGVKGVSMRGNKYRAYITVNYEIIRLGDFDTLESAAKARKEAEEKYWNNNKAV